jgi:chromate transporter
VPEPTKREPVPTERVSLATIFVRFVTIGALSFGGGIVAYLQRMLIDQTKWLTADEFLAALEISQTMPGLNAVNMSVLVGDRLRGPIGAFVAALGMVAPGAIFVFLLAGCGKSQGLSLSNWCQRSVFVGFRSVFH